MKTRELDLMLKNANPVRPEALAALDLSAGEAQLEEAIVAGPASVGEPSPRGAVRGVRRHWWNRAVAAVAGALAVVAGLVVLLLAVGGNEAANRTYAPQLVRFAQSSPLLLLEGPGWRVQHANEQRGREGIEGSMEFVTGKPVPYESIRVAGTAEAERASGLLPAAVRRRRVELWWRHGSLAEAIATQRKGPHPHGQRWLKLPLLGTAAAVDTRAEFFVNLGRPGDRRMVAYWSEDGYVLQLMAWVPDLAAFEERLGWLTKVDTQTWLEAMPASLVKAADHDAVVREVLKGIPVPRTFSPARVPDEGLTISRYQVGGQVTSTVSCLWFLQWAQARRSGDSAAELEAERAMATSRRWPILREMAKDGAFPNTIWQLAAEMPSGVWEHTGHRYPLLPRAESLGCARLGLPLLPRKQKLQRQRGVSPLPR